MTDIVGPNLDQLDAWGSLDSLAHSLDSSVWDSAALRYVAGSSATTFATAGAAVRMQLAVGSVAATFSESAAAVRTQFGVGSSAVAFTTAGESHLVHLAVGSAAVSVTPAASAVRVQLAEGSISAAVSTTGTAIGIIYTTPDSIAASFTSTAENTGVLSAIGTVTFSVTVDAAENALGESWSDITPAAAAWTTVTPDAANWATA